GQHRKAEESYRKAVAITTKLVAAHPQEHQYQNDLAVNWNNLGNLLKVTNRFDEATKAYAEAMTRYRLLLNAKPSDGVLRKQLADSHFNLGDLLFGRGDFPRAETHYLQAVELVTQKDAHATPEALNVLGLAYTGLGGVYERTGRKEQ